MKQGNILSIMDLKSREVSKCTQTTVTVWLMCIVLLKKETLTPSQGIFIICFHLKTVVENDFKYSFNRRTKLFHQKKYLLVLYLKSFSFVSMSYVTNCVLKISKFYGINGESHLNYVAISIFTRILKSK